MRYIEEEQYEKTMQEIVEPCIAAFRCSGYAERIRGQKIYYEGYHTADAKGVIVISHGFTESTAKYAESVYYMLQSGYNVWIFDHRGHGRSYRHNDNLLVVHVEDFEDYVQDLKYLTETVVQPDSGSLPLYLYCHSMGGCVGAWLIEDYPFLFKKAVLSSPMLKINFGPVPDTVLRVGATFKKWKDGGDRPSAPIESFAVEPDFEHSCDSCECRYLYYHHKRLAEPLYQTSVPSLNWGLESVKATHRVTSAYNCAKIQIPVLLFSAELDDVVKNEGHDIFEKNTAQCEHITVPGVKHEIYMSSQAVLKDYWEKIFSFLG